MQITLDSSWAKHLAGELEKSYVTELATFVEKEYKDGVVYPAPNDIFRAFDLCSFEQAKVVILGQDPYHGERQANGLAFAVDEGEAIPPSLRNIFKEIESDLGKSLAHIDGDLSRWAEQGVLLLNATLTVRAHTAGSHQEKGWERFTDAAIRALSQARSGLVFMLWGNYAKAKGAHIDRSKHLVLEAPHPSPLSAHAGFFGCKHFSRANDYLSSHAETPIDWL